MKRIKIVLNTLAITLAISGAFATHYYMQSNNPTQFIPVNGSYVPAGDYGVDYNCYDDDTLDVCTFYKPDSVNKPEGLSPYRKGRYEPVIN